MRTIASLLWILWLSACGQQEPARQAEVAQGGGRESANEADIEVVDAGQGELEAVQATEPQDVDAGGLGITINEPGSDAQPGGGDGDSPEQIATGPVSESIGPITRAPQGVSVNGTAGAVCRWGERHQGAYDQVRLRGCRPGLVCCYECGIAGCDSHCRRSCPRIPRP